MDIFKYAKSIDYGADYMDNHNGYIYHIQEYGELLKDGQNPIGIRVTDGVGNTIGYAQKQED